MTLDGNGEVKLSTVILIYQGDNNHSYLIKGKIKVMQYHRFLTPEGWKRARDLQVGDKIKTLQKGVFEEITAKERIATDIKVYNLQVADSHNFFISPDGKSAYLVHNSSDSGGSGESGKSPDLQK